jgi:hypothetical protein
MRLLQRRAHDTTAAAGDCRRTATFLCLLQYHRTAACPTDFDSRGDASAAAADNRNIEFQI